MLIAIPLPAALAPCSEAIRAKAAKAAKAASKLAFLLPSTKHERRWGWIVCLTAGICEEVVYRGFLLHYLHFLPFHVSLTRALVVSSVIFGIGHLYQGVAGACRRRWLDSCSGRCCWRREICCCRWRFMQCWTCACWRFFRREKGVPKLIK